MVELGRRIRSAREQRGLTQKSAAEAAGIATDMISRLENGRYTSPGLRTILRIADGLGTSVTELLPEGPKAPNTHEHGLRARLSSIVHRADARELELIVELATAVLGRAQRQRS